MTDHKQACYFICLTCNKITDQGEVSVSNVSVSRRSRSRDGLEAFFQTSRSCLNTVTPKSRSRLGLDAPTSWSQLLTSRLHRTSKFKLRTTTIKFSILYRDTWAA